MIRTPIIEADIVFAGAMLFVWSINVADVDLEPHHRLAAIPFEQRVSGKSDAGRFGVCFGYDREPFFDRFFVLGQPFNQPTHSSLLSRKKFDSFNIISQRHA